MCLGSLAWLAVQSAAQEVPELGLFGGYSFASLETGNGFDRVCLNGGTPPLQEI